MIIMLIFREPQSFEPNEELIIKFAYNYCVITDPLDMEFILDILIHRRLQVSL